MSEEMSELNDNEEYCSNSDSDSDWDEAEQEIDDGCLLSEGSSVHCLFCQEVFRSASETFLHCKTAHGFNIGEAAVKFNLDCFTYIKLINYIRIKKLQSAQDLFTDSEWKAIFAADNDVYMKPVLEDDALLMFDIEGLQNADGISAEVLRDSDDLDTVSVAEYNRLSQKLRNLEGELKNTEMKLQMATAQIDQMRNVFVNCLGNTSEEQSASAKDDDDDGYFNTYAHFGIHHEMLQDDVRTLSYRDAILSNSGTFAGRTVLDVGCGTGILSMFAAKAGSSVVVAVDQSEIVYLAMDIMRENRLENVVNVIKGRIEDVALPIESVDLILSEWMGYFLLFESMLDSVIRARDKYLRKPGGLLLPNRVTMNLAGISDKKRYRKLISFWDDVYGFKMTSMKGDVIKEASIEYISKDSLITSSALIHDLNLMTCTCDDVQFVSTFRLTVFRNEPLTAIVGWFDTYFDLPNKVFFSTSPLSTQTHWKQTVFYLPEPVTFDAGTILEGKISCTRQIKDKRSLKVNIKLQNYDYTYFLQ